MNYQDFCVQQLKNALNLLRNNKKLLNDISYKYALKSGLMGLYAETFTFKNEQMKFFDVNFSSKKYKGEEIWKKLLGSEAAYDLCRKYENGGIVNPSKKNKNVPFYEHIEPKSITYRKLCDLAEKPVIDDQEIKLILDKSKLVILTYHEKELLDGKKEVFNEQDKDLIEKWITDGKITEDDGKSAIDSMSIGNKFLKCDDNGLAYARIAHLWNKGVIFKWGDLCGIDAVSQYLQNNQHDY